MEADIDIEELTKLERDATSEHDEGGCSWGFTPPSPCPVCDKQALAEIRLYALGPALAQRVVADAALRAALEEIKRDEGHVCVNFGLCKHSACRSSYAASSCQRRQEDD